MKGDGTHPRLASVQNWIQRGNIRNDKIKVVSLEVSDTLVKGHAINNLEIISGSEICIVKNRVADRYQVRETTLSSGLIVLCDHWPPSLNDLRKTRGQKVSPRQ